MEPCRIREYYGQRHCQVVDTKEMSVGLEGEVDAMTKHEDMNISSTVHTYGS